MCKNMYIITLQLIAIGKIFIIYSIILLVHELWQVLLKSTHFVQSYETFLFFTVANFFFMFWYYHVSFYPREKFFAT